MGTSAHILLVEPPPSRADRQRAEVLLDHSQAMLSDFERRWTRFSPDSELSLVNSTPGLPVMVSGDTFELIGLAVDAWKSTGGLFDPTVLGALVQAGYDRPFVSMLQSPVPEDASPVVGVTTTPRHRPAPGCDGLTLVPGLCTVSVPQGVSIDLGGIGKGFAADQVCHALIGEGASGVCVDLGGDIRVMGSGPEDGAWILGIEHPCDADVELAAVALADGAVATSTRSSRHWINEDGPAHHLIDPATGLPAQSGLVSVSVVAGEAVTAEILAKAAFVAGSERGVDIITRAGAEGVLVADDGSVIRTRDFRRFEI